MTSTTTSKSPIRLGMIGCGLIASVHGEAMQASEDNISFVACTDQNPKAAEAWAHRFGATGVYTDMIDMVSKERLDGVVLATWPSGHHEHVAALIGAGVRHILCEKALAISGPLAAGILHNATSAGATVLEGFMFRHHPLYRQLEELVRAGVTGPIDTIRACFQENEDEDQTPDDAGRHWRKTKTAGGGIAYDGTCYPLHICNGLAASLPSRVCFEGASGRYDTTVRLHGTIRYENGIVGLIHSSLRAVVGREAEVTGAEASLYMPWAYGFNMPEHAFIRKRTGRSNLTMIDEAVASPRPAVHENRLAPRLQLEHFADVVRGNTSPRIPLVESVVNAFTLDAIIESAERRGSVDVRIPDAIRTEWLRVFERPRAFSGHV